VSIYSRWCFNSGSRLDIVERGQWYFVVDCKNCNRHAVLREAPFPEDVAEPVLATFPWRCPYCGDKRMCRPEQVQRTQGIYI
jgi:hypothetical protein